MSFVTFTTTYGPAEESTDIRTGVFRTRMKKSVRYDDSRVPGDESSRTRSAAMLHTPRSRGHVSAKWESIIGDAKGKTSSRRPSSPSPSPSSSAGDAAATAQTIVNDSRIFFTRSHRAPDPLRSYRNAISSSIPVPVSSVLGNCIYGIYTVYRKDCSSVPSRLSSTARSSSVIPIDDTWELVNLSTTDTNSRSPEVD